MIEIHHLLNLFTASDYMRICRVYMYSNTATHEQNQEYIRLSGKIMEQYSKGMLTLKAYRDGLPQIQNNKIQNNTLNQVNIHGRDEEKIEQQKPKWVECKESFNAEKIIINKKEEV